MAGPLFKAPSLKLFALLLGVLLAPPLRAQDAPAGVIVERTPAGYNFVTINQRTLYWSQDELGAKSITCLEACLETWQPLPAPENVTEVAQGWSTVARPDFGLQWAYNGRPIYTFVGDTFPGARLGAFAGYRQAKLGKWNILFEQVELPSGLSLQSSLLGRVLADHKGRTLYTHAKETSPPTDKDWRPLLAPWLAEIQGDWSFQPLPDGTRQWMYKGNPLFLFDRDKDPEDVRGHGVGGLWSAIILETPPGLPTWMTIQRVDLGWVFAAQNGMTIYAPSKPDQIEQAQTCPEDCMQKFWRPVLAEPADKPVGRWSIVEIDGGLRQWTFNGRLLFTHTRDKKPGDMTGNSYAVGYAIGDGFRVILIEANMPPAI